MEWRVRPADAGDVERLALIGAASFLETFAGILEGDAIVGHCAKEHSVDAYRALMAKTDTAAWLAEAEPGGAPVAYAMVTAPKLDAAQEGDLELKRIYALSRTHGSELGAALMARAVSHAEQAGATRLLLGVFLGNLRAIAFYQRHGFTKIAERRFQVGSQLCEDVVLARSLG